MVLQLGRRPSSKPPYPTANGHVPCVCSRVSPEDAARCEEKFQKSKMVSFIIATTTIIISDTTTSPPAAHGTRLIASQSNKRRMHATHDTPVRPPTAMYTHQHAAGTKNPRESFTSPLCRCTPSCATLRRPRAPTWRCVQLGGVLGGGVGAAAIPGGLAGGAPTAPNQHQQQQRRQPPPPPPPTAVALRGAEGEVGGDGQHHDLLPVGGACSGGKIKSIFPEPSLTADRQGLRGPASCWRAQLTGAAHSCSLHFQSGRTVKGVGQLFLGATLRSKVLKS